MAAVTVYSDFGAQEKKICHHFHFFPFYLSWSVGTRWHDLSFWRLSFKPASPLSSFTLFKRLFSSSLLSAIRVVSSAHLSLLMLLPEISIPASCDFLMMYSAHKLNKQGDNIQPCCTLFPTLNQSVVPCPVLTVASWLIRIQVSQETGKMVWHSHLFKNFPKKIKIKIFHSSLWSTESKAFAEPMKQK